MPMAPLTNNRPQAPGCELQGMETSTGNSSRLAIAFLSPFSCSAFREVLSPRQRLLATVQARAAARPANTPIATSRGR